MTARSYRMLNRNDQKPEMDARTSAELGAALSQLSSTMDKLVTETIEAVGVRGIDAYELTPLMKLRDTVRALTGIAAVREPREDAMPQPAANPQAAADYSQQHAHFTNDARGNTVEASEHLLARASAVIDVMIQGGDDPEHASQMLARQLLIVGIKLPEAGGDARAWKRLFNWRSNLIHHKRAGPAWDIYCAFKEELERIPPEERLRRAVGERLWDRREIEFSGKESA